MQFERLNILELGFWLKMILKDALDLEVKGNGWIRLL